MNSYPFDKGLSTEDDVLDYFIDAISYRGEHKDASQEIARHVFDTTHPRGRLSFPVKEPIERIRDEFGALEAPGMPIDDNIEYDEYEDSLWERLLGIVTKTKKEGQF